MQTPVPPARAACDSARWGDARRAFELLPVEELGLDDLDAFATASYLTGQDELSFDLWGRAYQICVSSDDVARAAHFGMRVAECLGFKGDFPRLSGWVDRTARLLQESPIDCVERGHLEHALAMGALFADGDVPSAMDHFERAGKIGARHADRELVTLARIGRGRMQIYLGDIAEGVALLDEAMVSIEAGELSVVSTGDAYCTVIDACAELSDVLRCRSWTASMLRWCDAQQDLVLYRGHCFVHCAEVLGVQGRWHDALSEARSACDRLATTVPGALGAAANLEGDLLRELGDLDAAEAAYVRANELGHQPQPGLALLHLRRGDVAAANAMIERALVECEVPLLRARLLPARCDIALVATDIETAWATSGELAEIGRELRSPLLIATAARMTGATRLRHGDAAGALSELRRAFRLFNELDARVELARVRLLIADACRAVGDAATADLEESAGAGALSAFAMPGDPGVIDDPVMPELPDGLTRRELDVLLLLARGKTNRVIGEELFISEKTVATHVSHIFSKTGVTSRSGATAYAYDRGLT